MGNNSFNTLLDLYQTAKISETNRNTNLLFQAAMEQNELILQLQKQIENAQAHSNRIAVQQLEVQLRDEMAKHEQRLLKAFIFNIEVILEDLSQLTKLEEYIFLNKEFTPILEHMPDAIDRLENIEDKRVANKLFKKLDERLKLSKSAEKEFKKSDFFKLEKIEEDIQNFELPAEPKKEYVPEPQRIPYIGKYGVSTYLFILGTTITFLTFLGLFDSIKETGISDNLVNIFFCFYLVAQIVILPLYYVIKRKNNHRTRDEIEAENQKLKAKNDEIRIEKQKVYDREMQAFRDKETELKQLKLQKSELENRIKSEHSNYIHFQKKVLKMFSPNKFENLK
ncbi:tetraspanin family protein [Leptospira bouyouniensis]|uniref:Uncharacterized protein n=1 Tax=Leptospira bouyouniensis TaxID=2484911 RepID=A0ABY2L9R9_9LEPT|nr:tetraspanin family protein [Leptospira bouyouniensis]TGK54250.1 hypothetical protein EHQ10_00350 [Leptospira bouyouniensis]